MTDHTPELVGAAEAAEILGVDRSYLSRLSRLEPVRRMPGAKGSRLYLRADVEALAAERAATLQHKLARIGGSA